MISHPHKTIFIHIPKCGGQSVEECFLSDLGLNWQERAPLLLLPNDISTIGPPRLAHLTGTQYLKYHYATREMFDQYYTFSVMRDPIDRTISLYNYLPLKRNGVKIGFDEFLMKWLPKQLEMGEQSVNEGDLENRFWFVRPQSDFILNPSRKVMVKDIFLLENLTSDFLKLREKSGLQSAIKHINKSKAIFTKDRLKSWHISQIERLYKEDHELILALQKQRNR